MTRILPSPHAAVLDGGAEKKARRHTTNAKRRSIDIVPFFGASVAAAPAHEASGDVPAATVLRARIAQHWDVLRSPYRMRLFEAIRASGGCSARDLASALSTSCTALYYHLDRLEQAGLVATEAAPLPEGERFRGGRRPSIYRAVAENVIVECDEASARDMRRLKKLGESWADETRAESGRPHLRGATQAATHDVEFTRWESVTEDEAATVRNLMAQVEAVLDHARARREHIRTQPVVANAVISCLCTVPRDQVFPSPTIGVRVVSTAAPRMAERAQSN